MFRFRLEPLITIRDNELNKKQGELAKAYEARRIVEEKQREIERELAENIESGRKMIQSGEIRVEFLLGLRRNEAYLGSQLRVIRQHLIQIDEEIERRRAAVMEAHKELKIVEKLKEKRKAQYLAEEAKKETVLMDEIAQNRSRGSNS